MFLFFDVYYLSLNFPLFSILFFFHFSAFFLFCFSRNIPTEIFPLDIRFYVSILYFNILYLCTRQSPWVETVASRMAQNAYRIERPQAEFAPSESPWGRPCFNSVTLPSAHDIFCSFILLWSLNFPFIFKKQERQEELNATRRVNQLYRVRLTNNDAMEPAPGHRGGIGRPQWLGWRRVELRWVFFQRW